MTAQNLALATIHALAGRISRRAACVLLTAFAITAGLRAEALAEPPIVFTYNKARGKCLATYTTTFFSARQQFVLTNNTGRTWTGFRVRLAADGQFGDYDFPRFTDLGGDDQIYYGPGSTIFRDRNEDAYGYNEIMLVIDLTIEHGQIYEFSSDILSGIAPEGMTELRIYGRPRAPVQAAALEDEPRFVRGDGNSDGSVDISDAGTILNWLFADAEAPRCMAAANPNGDDSVDIADPAYLLNWLFLAGPAPVAPFPECGTADVTSDAGFTDVELGCEVSTCRTSGPSGALARP